MTEQTGNNKPNDAEGLAFPLSGNEKLIEEARRAKRAVYLATDASVADDLSRIIGGLADALEAAEEAHTTTPPDGWFYMGSHVGAPWLNLEFSEEMDETGLPLWERPVQHTPTDDEREALARWLHLRFSHAAPISQSSTWEGLSDRFKAAWLDLAGDAPHFHHSVVPEPSTECPQPCVHLSQHDAREGRTCAEHPCTCPEPQGEPSSAGVDDAWWKAQEAGQLPRTPGPSIRQAFKAGYRAALRAAGVGGVR